MAWENPVTTWGQAGKTVPGAGDFNRIEGNTQYLKDEVDLHKEDETAHITPDERNDWNSKAAGSHNHSASDINTGTLPIARGGTGGTTVATARNNLGVAQTRVYNGKLQYYDGGWKDVGGSPVKSVQRGYFNAPYSSPSPPSISNITISSVNISKSVLIFDAAHGGCIANLSASNNIKVGNYWGSALDCEWQVIEYV